MTERTFDVKLGDKQFRLAGDALSRELFGVPAFRRYWRELNADISGPGETNPNERRWVITDWGGGEGQKVVNPEDTLAAVRYDRSNSIDLSTPSEIKLGKLFSQTSIEGTSGGGTTTATVEASAMTGQGSTTVSGTDRILNAFEAAAYTDITYQAGQHQVEFYGYSESAGVIGATATVEGNDATWNLIQGNKTNQGTDTLLQPAQDNTAVIQSDAFDPPEHDYRVVCHVQGNKNAGGPARALVQFELRDATTGNIITSNQKQLKSEDGDYGNVRTFAISFATQAGRTYRYRITVLSQEGTGKGVLFDKIVASIAASGGEQAELYVYVADVTSGVTTLSSHRADVQNDTSSTRIHTADFTVTGANRTIRFSFQRGIASVNVVADKIIRTTMSAGTPFKDVYNLHFGQGSEIWAADVDPAAPSTIAKFSGTAGGWDSVVDISTNGDKVIQFTNSDNNEYAVMVGGTVWKITPPSTGTQYTAAYTSPVGIAVAGDRLYVLTESDAAGVRLWEQTLDTTAGLPLAIGTAIYNPITAGTPADQSPVRRMASTPTGPVFFVNRAAECTVYAWNSVSASPTIVASVSGFRARAIAHSAGLTFIAGENPVTEGGTKAAMFVLDNVTGPAAPEFLNLPFERDGDPDAYIQDLQVFGPNVFALAQVETTPPTMRLWRVSLADPGGLFQEADVPLATGDLTRALAITAGTRAIAGDSGGPHVATTAYVTGQVVYLRTSLNAFGLLDDKRLKGLSVTGLFPTGTSVHIRYSLDNGTTWLEAGQWTADETKTIPTADLDPLFKNLQLEIVPAGTTTATPTIYQVEAIAELTRGTGPPGSVGGREQVFQMVLDCRDESATSHIPGQQASGYSAYNYIWSLLALQTTSMEERYYTPKGAAYVVELDILDQHMLGPGEALLKVEAIER